MQWPQHFKEGWSQTYSSHTFPFAHAKPGNTAVKLLAVYPRQVMAMMPEREALKNCRGCCGSGFTASFLSLACASRRGCTGQASLPRHIGDTLWTYSWSHFLLLSHQYILFVRHHSDETSMRM